MKYGSFTCHICITLFSNTVLAQPNPRNLETGWNTDTSNRIAPLEEFIKSCPDGNILSTRILSVLDDPQISKSGRIGSVTVFRPTVEDRKLTFLKTSEGFVD